MTYFTQFAALTGLLLTALAINVSRLRFTRKIGNGDGGNRELRRAIRAHVNAVEHGVVYALLILGLAYVNLPYNWLATLGYGFLATRLLHAYSMLAPQFRLRQTSALITYLFELIAAFLLLWLSTR